MAGFSFFDNIFDGKHPETYLDPNLRSIGLPYEVFNALYENLEYEYRWLSALDDEILNKGECKNLNGQLYFNFVSMDKSSIYFRISINSL